MNLQLEKKSVELKYIRGLKYAYWPLKIVGFNRFDIVDGKIVGRSTSSMFISLLNIFMIHLCGLYTLYEIAYKNKYLHIGEIGAIIEFGIFQTFLLLHTTFTNRSSCSKFLNTGIDIDSFIGSKNTAFMRDVFRKTYIYLCSFAAVTELTVSFVLYFAYYIENSTKFVAGIYFFLLYSIYYDLAFFLALYTSLTLRIRYLNVGIMKMTNFNIDRLPDQFPFNTLFWKKDFNKIVDFHQRADPEKFTKAFRMIFDQVRCLEKCYRFTILACLICLTIGTFATTQMFIIYAKSSNMDPIRLAALTGWCLLCWWYQIIMSQQTDMFQRQINQTNLICTYIQLRQNYPEEIYKLVSDVISTLQVRDPRVSIYGFFYFDTGLLLKIGATIFAYIAMQLQIGFSINKTIVLVNNVTSVDNFTNYN